MKTPTWLPAFAALLFALPAGAGTPPAPAAATSDPLAAARSEALALARQAAAALAPPGARIEVEALPLDRRLRLAPCARVQAAAAPGARAWGRTRAALRCTEGARWTAWLPLSVKVFAPAPVAAQALPAGTVLAGENLQTAEVDWAAPSTPPATDAAALAGRTLARNVAAGQPLRAADLRQRRWFAAGDTVRVRAGGSGYSVSTAGRALGPGIEGQRLAVRLDNGRVVNARAVGEAEVELSL